MHYVWSINGPRDNGPDDLMPTLAKIFLVIAFLAAVLGMVFVGLDLYGLLFGEVERSLPVPGPIFALACIAAMVATATAAHRAIRREIGDVPLKLMQNVGIIIGSALLGYATIAMATYGSFALNAIVTAWNFPRLADLFAIAVIATLAVGIVLGWPGRWRLGIGLVLAVAVGGAMALGLAGTDLKVF